MINVSINKEDASECEVEMIAGEISKIRVCEIPGDGNCLFGATVHQHFHLKVGSDEYKQRTVELRGEVVAHIRSNLKRYERTILDRIFKKHRNDKNSSKTSEEQCEEFLSNYLSKENHWGGSETITAISELLKVNVIVFDEWGDVRFGNSFNLLHQSVITLAYRVSKKINRRDNPNDIHRDHYDSVVKLSDDVLFKSTSILMKNHSKMCSLKNISDAIVLE